MQDLVIVFQTMDQMSPDGFYGTRLNNVLQKGFLVSMKETVTVMTKIEKEAHHLDRKSVV